MRVYKDSKTDRWYVDYHFRGRRVRYPAGATNRDADQLKSRITLEINAGEHSPSRTKRAVKGTGGESIFFEVPVAVFLREYRPRGGSIHYDEQRAKVWQGFFSGTPIGAISSDNVEKMLRAR